MTGVWCGNDLMKFCRRNSAGLRPVSRAATSTSRSTTNVASGRPAPRSLDSVVSDAALLLGMERIGNPDNVGGLFRTAAAFGVNGILLDARSSDPYYRKSIRTSMAAVLDMPFATIDDWPATLHPLRDRKFDIVALTPSPGAIDLDEFITVSRSARTLVLVGAEGSGKRSSMPACPRWKSACAPSSARPIPTRRATANC